jgi:hypothetical protein
MVDVTTIPNAPSQERERLILEAIIGGQAEPIVWCPITSAKGNHVCKLWVAEDALKVGGIRLTMTHRTAQQVADYFDARLPTARISDMTWAQATVRVAPLPQYGWVVDGTMSHTDRMVEISRMVDELIAGRKGLVSSVGKDWVLTKQLVPDRAANYGWHRLRDGKPWQPVGLAHDLGHTDYSEGVRLVCRTCEVDGVRMPLDNVLRSKELATLVSHEGVLPFVRHPGVTWVEPGAALEDP